MVPNYRHGRGIEAFIVRELQKLGIFAMRAPASGRGTKRVFYPDIVVFVGSNLFFIEVKSTTTKNEIIIAKSQFFRYIENAEKFNAIPLICAKFAPDPNIYCKCIRDFDRVVHSGFVYEYESMKKHGIEYRDLFIRTKLEGFNPCQ